ncbi:MAG TPA: penicillin-binding protein activator [Acetobacteraceae bacterium]
MLRRAFVLLLGTLALAGCGGAYTGGYGNAYQSGGYGSSPVGLGPHQQGGGSGAGQQVALLLPLSGPRADIGQSMRQAAELALSEPGSPTLDVRDTGGTPQGATTAAQAAIAAGDRLILGPLTSAETASVAPVARAAGVAVLAFTNDPSQAQPGIWTLGITPAQQVRRLVAAAQEQGHSQMAALLPNNDFGRAMADALNHATAAAGLPPPRVRMHGSGMAAITAATRDLADYADRRGPIDAQIKAARALETPEGRRTARDLAKSSIPPPPFDTLLLGDTRDELAEVAAVLPYYDVNRSAVQILGPALWAASSSGSGQMSGAWYAAPDPASRSSLEQDYTARYNSPPSPLADLAYDAAAIARVLASEGGFSIAALARPGGYDGVDGWLLLLPDGQVRRGLAVFRIERGGPQMIEPAPTSGTAPGA